jgi:hypothetical protein
MSGSCRAREPGTLACEFRSPEHTRAGRLETEIADLSAQFEELLENQTIECSSESLTQMLEWLREKVNSKCEHAYALLVHTKITLIQRARGEGGGQEAGRESKRSYNDSHASKAKADRAAMHTGLLKPFTHVRHAFIV